MNRADVDQKLPGDFRMSERNHAVLDSDFAENAGVLFLESFAAPFEVIEDAIKFRPRQVAERISAANQVENFVNGNRRPRGRESNDMLSDNVVRLLLNLDRV